MLYRCDFDKNINGCNYYIYYLKTLDAIKYLLRINE